MLATDPHAVYPCASWRDDNGSHYDRRNDNRLAHYNGSGRSDATGPNDTTGTNDRICFVRGDTCRKCQQAQYKHRIFHSIDLSCEAPDSRQVDSMALLRTLFMGDQFEKEMQDMNALNFLYSHTVKGLVITASVEAHKGGMP
jgi:hypothetical protein